MARASSSGEMPEASAKPDPAHVDHEAVAGGLAAGLQHLLDDGLEQRRAGDVELAVEADPDRRRVLLVRLDVDGQGRLRAAHQAPSVIDRLADRSPPGSPDQDTCLPDATPSAHRRTPGADTPGSGPGRLPRMGREFATIGVVGLGTMGAGIVEVFAREGLQVVGVEPTEELLERGRGHLRHSTDRAVARGKLSEADRDALVGPGRGSPRRWRTWPTST